jgi:phosphonate transport system substrate-binding protein
MKSAAKRLQNVMAVTLAAICGALSTNAMADDLSLSVYPILPSQEARRAFLPLANYLHRRTGHNIQILTSVNYLAHWQVTRRGQSALILEGPHMIDYRVKKMKYTVLAKIPEVVSFSVVAHRDQMLMDPGDLIGRSVATMPSPSLGALRLNEFFPNPLRQPLLVEVDDMEQAVKSVMDNKAAAALIPSSMVSRYPELSTIATTEQAPAPGIVAAPWVSEETKRALRQALVEAHMDPEGQAALEVLRLPRFDPGAPEQFAGYAKLLEGMWGY